ncbi:MAG: histidine phosphatase family protein [Bacteroidia bacterium]|nr:histidine phosphatase family protein [Bacteroidia bacterium]
MELILVRHAKSLHNDYVEQDIERHLCDRGYHDAAVSSGWCSSKKIVPDLMLSSPAIRAFSTALIFANRLGYASDAIRLEAAIYEASVRNLVYVLDGIPEGTKTCMLFGHNPGFTELLNYLCGPVCSQLPTAAVARITLRRSPGGKIEPARSELLDLFSGHKPF